MSYRGNVGASSRHLQHRVPTTLASTSHQAVARLLRKGGSNSAGPERVAHSCSYFWTVVGKAQCLAQEWLDAGAARQDSVCATMQSEIALSEIWLRGTADNLASNADDVAALPSTTESGSRVFSHFEYSSSCGGEPLRVPIEPLVGLFRHPLVVEGCNPEGHSLMVDIRHDAIFPGEPLTGGANCVNDLPNCAASLSLGR